MSVSESQLDVGADAPLSASTTAHTVRERVYDLALIVPVRAKTDEEGQELGEFYASFARRSRAFTIQVFIPDVSTERRFQRLHAALIDTSIDHFRPQALPPVGRNPKLNAIHATLAKVNAPAVVMVDDDVRPTDVALLAIASALQQHACVRTMVSYVSPNCYDQIDLAGVFIINTLLPQRQFWGNISCSSEFLNAADFPARDGLFDELVLQKHCERNGGRTAYIARPVLEMSASRRTFGKFLEQRVRYAYENLALPVRTLVYGSLTPGLIVVSTSAGVGAATMLAVAITVFITLAARVGSRRYAQSARDREAWRWAAVWFWPYAMTTWVALFLWCRGGVEFGGQRIRRPM